MSECSKPDPELTIAIPTYNRAGSLHKLLSTLREQPEIGRVQVLVSDNGSTDATRGVLREFSSSLNLGAVGFASNRGFDANYVNCAVHARGRYLWIMGDDDTLVPGAVRDVLALLESRAPDLVVCNGGDVRQGRLVPRIARTPGAIGTPLDLAEQVGWHLCWIGTSIVRRALLDVTALQAQDHNAFVHIPLLMRSLPPAFEAVFVDRVVLSTTVNNSDYFRDPTTLIRTFGQKLHDTLQCLGTSPRARAASAAIVRGFHDHLGMFGWRDVAAHRKAGRLSLGRFLKNLKFYRRVNGWAPLHLVFFIVPPVALRAATALRRRRSSHASD